MRRITQLEEHSHATLGYLGQYRDVPTLVLQLRGDLPELLESVRISDGNVGRVSSLGNKVAIQFDGPTDRGDRICGGHPVLCLSPHRARVSSNPRPDNIPAIRISVVIGAIDIEKVAVILAHRGRVGRNSLELQL